MNALIRHTPRGGSLLPFDSQAPWLALEDDINRLLETAAVGLLAPGLARRVPVDVYEDKDSLFIRADLPGVTREDISVEMADGTLVISASRKNPATEGSPDEAFSLSRSITIPDAVQTEKVTATYENGVLTVTLPKQEESKPKKITVAVQ